MAQISNLNVQINQNQVNSNSAQVAADGRVAAPRSPIPGLRSGSLVEGQVLSQQGDGSYMVRINGRELLARATLSLIVGEHFRAVWDASGEIPVLRLSQNELSFLSQLPQADRELATALLSRGMPLSNEVLLSIREAWRRMGAHPEQLGPLLELWARGASMTQENVQTMAWFLALNGEAGSALWARIRKELKERAGKGENPVDILRSMRDGDGEVSRFLQGYSLLLRAPREDVNPLLLGAPFWPMDDGAPHLAARVFVGRVHQQEGRHYWQMGFGVEGSRLGFIGGNVESDGKAYNINLYAEENATCELLKRKRHAIRKELEDVPLALQYIGISRIITDALRDQLLAGRGLDLTV